MTVYLGRDWKCVTATVAATHTIYTELTARLENVGHKLLMDNFFLSHNLHDNLLVKNINCFGTVRPNPKGVLRDYGKKLKMKRSDMKTRVRGDMLSVLTLTHSLMELSPS
jgi:hypothetical protein